MLQRSFFLKDSDTVYYSYSLNRLYFTVNIQNFCIEKFGEQIVNAVKKRIFFNTNFCSFFLMIIAMIIFLKVSATGACGTLTGLRYSLRESSTSQTFSIDEQRGKICVINPLDYEVAAKYQLIVVANDQSI